MDDYTMLEIDRNIDVETITITGNTAAAEPVAPSLVLGNNGTITIGNTTINENQLAQLIDLIGSE